MVGRGVVEQFENFCLLLQAQCLFVWNLDGKRAVYSL